MHEQQTTTYAQLLKEAGRFHGDVCRGIEIGTRMTMVGLREIGITDPKGKDRKDLIVFAEIDRCATDAITALTGCRPGKRTMKVLDYGKMAATFVNLESRHAVRVSMREKNEDSPGDDVPLDNIPDEVLFHVTAVKVDLRPEDLPGRPLRVRTCARCGENIMDGREIESGGETLCRPCFEQKAYYRPCDGADA